MENFIHLEFYFFLEKYESEKPSIIKNKTCSLDELKGNINYLSGEVGGQKAHKTNKFIFYLNCLNNLKHQSLSISPIF